jgi:hypothetical protein
MKIAGITVVALLMVSSAALAEDYEAREFHACAKSLEQWEETHGRKVEETMARLGAFSERVIVWDSGARVRATVGPTSDGRICVLASRFLGRDVATAAQ